MNAGAPLRIDASSTQAPGVYTSDYRLVGHLVEPAKPAAEGLMLATASGAQASFHVQYFGPVD
jgi:hypothetical protein